MAEYFELNRKIPCASSEEILSALKEFQEIPIWYGNISETTKAVLLINQTTTSWTFLLAGDNTICVITSGKGFSYRPINKGMSI